MSNQNIEVYRLVRDNEVMREALLTISRVQLHTMTDAQKVAELKAIAKIALQQTETKLEPGLEAPLRGLELEPNLEHRAGLEPEGK